MMNKIAVKFLVFVASIILIVVLIGLYLLSNYTEDTIKESTNAQIELNVKKISENLDLTNSLYLEHVKTGMGLLKYLLNSEGVPNLKDGTLKFGNTAINNNYNIVDKVKNIAGGTATIFIKDGEQFIRISTNVIKDDGTRAVGTELDPTGKAYQAANKGIPFYGLVNILGKPYITGYEPILDEERNIIGIYYTGYPLSTLTELGKKIEETKLLDNGFISLVNNKNDIEFLSSIITKDEAKKIIDSKVSEKFGKWVVKSTVFDKWGYFIIAAYPIKDIETRVNVVKTGLLISAIIFGLVIIIILYVLVNKMILAYVKQLAVASEKVSKGDTTIKVKINTKDEIGLLADSFNNMVEGINESILHIKEKEKLANEAALAAKLAEEEAVKQQQYLTEQSGKMMIAMSKFSKGDLTVNLKVESNDDIGKLFAAFNDSIINVRKMIEELNYAVSHTKASSDKIMRNTETISTGAHEQSAQTSEVATAVEEMSRTIYETSQSANLANNYSKQASSFASEGGKIVYKTIDGMHNISEAVEQVAKIVKHLGESSTMIGEIVQVINDIADQTNLLALNAAIEAARAGEQGRGFAVVADEVRKLAERTTKATKEIAAMIKQIQTDTKDAVASMDNGTNRVSEGKNLAQQAGDALKDIIDNTTKVNEAIMQVAAAAEQQSSAAEQISRNIESINSVSQQTAHDVSQIAEASSELNDLTETLSNMVKRFTISENSIYKY